MKQVKNPCQGCIYFPACGDNTRREPCEGRKTKRQQAQEQREEARRK